MRLGRVAQTTQKVDEPNVTPLIDIVFILLIFFVVTTTFARDFGLDIQRPRATTGARLPNRIVRVAVSKANKITVDGREISSWRLEAEVSAQLSKRETDQVLLVADAGLEAQTLVDVMDGCRRAGGASVALAVEGTE